MKFCSKCKIEKDLKDFYKEPRRKRGVRSECKLCFVKVREPWKLNNKEKIKKWFIDNNKKHLINVKSWKIKNKGKYASYVAKRRASKLQATPKWLSKEQVLEIEEFYESIQEVQWLSEKKLSVDHVVPLQGKNVCGLHVPWNLQILLLNDNISKKNRF